MFNFYVLNKNKGKIIDEPEHVTNSAITISDWQYEISDGAPDGFFISAPTVETITDENGEFEISTISIAFSGSAQNGTCAFSLNYSFKLSSGENLVDLRVSSDDNATLTACGKTAISTLHSNGWARSNWSATRMGITEVSGTYTNIGGPHHMTATVRVIRSLNGKVFDVNFVMSEPKVETTELYQETRVTVTCSGNAPYGNFGFTATETFTISGGNWIKFEVASDDNAIVRTESGSLTATSTIGASCSAKSDWIEQPPNTISVVVTLTNVGGPFSLALAITTRRALVEPYFEAQQLSADDYIASQKLPVTSRSAFEQEKKISRSVFGCGEIVHIKFRDIENKIPLEAIPEEIMLSGDVYTTDGKVFFLNTNYTTDKECACIITFPGDFIVNRAFLIKIPQEEIAEEISQAKYLELAKTTLPFDTESDGIFAFRCFRVVVLPTNVSFGNLYFWEVGALEESSLFFATRDAEECIHMPNYPCKLNTDNAWYDLAYLFLPPEYASIAEGYYRVVLTNEIFNELEEHETTKNGRTISETVIGRIIWKCPVHWSLTDPGRDQRSREQCIEEQKALNEDLPKSGELSPRLQTMTLNYNIDIGGESNIVLEDFLDITIKKDFNTLAQS